jgi:hypothetical protein
VGGHDDEQASARGGGSCGGHSRRDSHCSGTGAGEGTAGRARVRELKAKPDDGRLEVEFEVDTNRAGQTWQVRITDNGQLVARRSARTVAPSGSFTVHAHPANRAGADVIRTVGVRGDNTCSATVRL